VNKFIYIYIKGRKEGNVCRGFRAQKVAVRRESEGKEGLRCLCSNAC
jgi:hypothetical protein